MHRRFRPADGLAFLCFAKEKLTKRKATRIRAKPRKSGLGKARPNSRRANVAPLKPAAA